MKKFLATAAMAAAMAMPGVAHADNIAFSGQAPLLGGLVTVSTSSAAVYAGTRLINGNVGYDQFGFNAGNIEAASPTISNTWLIKGAVTKDCSYYGGTNTAHTLDFGTIGVNTQAATSVGNAFDMVSAATATVNSTTAGCNFNNRVTLTKANGAEGLKNSVGQGGFDSNEFQNTIPYSVAATFTATTNTSGPAAGSAQNVTAGTGDASATKDFGAWRSAMTLNINAPAPAKALVAGNYSDTLTVELKAL